MATPNPGAQYLLSRGGGVLADEAALGDTLNRLLGDPQRRDALGAEALARAADFAWDVVCRDYERAYQAAIEAHADAARGRPEPGLR